jgi:putative ABC transport system permease protein
MTMVRTTLTGLRARKLRLFASGLAVVLGVMFVSAAFVLTDTLNRSFDGIYTSLYEGTEVRVTAKQVLSPDDDTLTTPVPADLVARIAAVDGVAAATGVVSEDGARLIGPDGKVVTTSLGRPRLGTNWAGQRGPLRLRTGRGPERPDEIAVDATLARIAKIKIGDAVSVLTQRPGRSFTVVGIFGYTGGRDSLGGAHEIAFHESVAPELMLGRPGGYSAVDVRAAPGVTPAALRDRVRAALGDGVKVRLGSDLRAAQSASAQDEVGVMSQILLFVAGIALFVGAFLILNTFSILVAQRTRELALLRALGAARRQVIGSVLLEATLVGVTASALGVVLGAGAGVLLPRIAGSTGVADLGLGGGLGGATVPVAPLAASFVVGLLVTIGAALMPALRASRIPPIAALRETAAADRPITAMTVAGGVVAAAGAAMLIGAFASGGDEIPQGLVFGGVLVSFVGAALLTPVVARPAVGLIGRLFAWSVPGRLGRLNARRNPRRTAVTASALMIGVALVTGVNVVLTSATVSLTADGLAVMKADLVLSSVASTTRPVSFDPAVLDRVRALPGVTAVMGEYSDYGLVDGDRGAFLAIDDLAAWRDMTRVTPRAGTIDAIGADQVIVDAATAANHGVSLGSPVTFTFTSGRTRTMTVSGVFTSNDWAGGWILPMSVVPELGYRQPNRGLVRLAPGASETEVRGRIAGLLADDPEIVVTDVEGFLYNVFGIFRTVIGLLHVLLGLAMLIAALGVVNTLVLSVLERTRELGLLRAVGLDRRQAVRMITVEAVVVSLFGAVLGLAVGVGLGAAVARSLSGEGVDRIALPWGYLGAYLVAGAVIGVLAAVLPAVRAARTDVLRAIAYE